MYSRSVIDILHNYSVSRVNISSVWVSPFGWLNVGYFKANMGLCFFFFFHTFTIGHPCSSSSWSHMGWCGLDKTRWGVWLGQTLKHSSSKDVDSKWTWCGQREHTSTHFLLFWLCFCATLCHFYRFSSHTLSWPVSLYPFNACWYLFNQDTGSNCVSDSVLASYWHHHMFSYMLSVVQM